MSLLLFKKQWNYRHVLKTLLHSGTLIWFSRECPEFTHGSVAHFWEWTKTELKPNSRFATGITLNKVVVKFMKQCYNEDKRRYRMWGE